MKTSSTILKDLNSEYILLKSNNDMNLKMISKLNNEIRSLNTDNLDLTKQIELLRDSNNNNNTNYNNRKESSKSPDKR